MANDYRKPPKFAVINFEFTNLGKNKLILISGAILGRYESEMVTKLEGRALILKEQRQVTDAEWKAMVQHIVNFIGQKPTQLISILAQIYDSDVTTNPNLTSTFIRTKLKAYDVIILWEGSSDIKILSFLGVHQLALSMSGWDVNQDGQFYLQLIDMDDKKLLSHTI